MSIPHAGTTTSDISSKTQLRVLFTQVSGASGTGKSFFITQLFRFKDYIFTHQFHRIIYSHPGNDHSQVTKDTINEMRKHVPNLEICYDVPTIDKLGLNGATRHSLVVIDDLGLEVLESKEMKTLFNMGSRHELISLVFVTQNLYTNGKFSRDVRVNLTHNCILR